MRVFKVLNNNVIISIDSKSGKEIVIMGKGIAFQKSKGDLVDQDKIEKIFAIKNEGEGSKFEEMFKNVPHAILELSETIIIYAEKELDKSFENNVHLALADHLAFAVQRMRNGLTIKNHLLWEIRKIYRKEYQVGIWALEVIERELELKMPEDEAGFIALHLINATMGEDMPNTMDITAMVQDILNLIKYLLKIEYKSNSLYYDRLVTHIRFFAQRVIGSKKPLSGDTPFYEMMQQNYKNAFAAALKIKEYVEKNYNYQVEKDEIVYLCLHIQRVIEESKVN